jgi:hypothetical protein
MKKNKTHFYFCNLYLYLQLGFPEDHAKEKKFRKSLENCEISLTINKYLENVDSKLDGAKLLFLSTELYLSFIFGS